MASHRSNAVRELVVYFSFLSPECVLEIHECGKISIGVSHSDHICQIPDLERKQVRSTLLDLLRDLSHYSINLGLTVHI